MSLNVLDFLKKRIKTVVNTFSSFFLALLKRYYSVLSIFYNRGGFNIKEDSLSTSVSQKQMLVNKQIINKPDHPIVNKKIDTRALKVLNRLYEYGFEAYLVGGFVRDLYTGLVPKDFDVSTNATPQEIKRIFRNSRIIGRRFKIVHIYFEREIIEVATFRANSDDEKTLLSSSGRILKDNVFGVLEDDAVRRDLTINALYYDAQTESIIDFFQSVKDINQKIIKLIGDPVTRYREDPVRMLRVVRFQAKLGFYVDSLTEMPIYKLGYLLSDIPTARLFDEMVKIFQSGQGVKAFELLHQYQLLQYLLPLLVDSSHQSNKKNDQFLILALENTDRRVREKKPITPAFIFAVFLWHPMLKICKELKKKGLNAGLAIEKAMDDIIDQQVKYTAIPKRLTQMMRDIWRMQHKLVIRKPKQIRILLGHPKFRAAYDFLLLQEASGVFLKQAGQWWTEIQDKNEEGVQEMIDSLSDLKKSRKKSSKRLSE